MKRLIMLPFMFALFAFLSLSGCSMLPIEEPPLMPPIVHAPEAHIHQTVATTRGDVIRHMSLFASYVPAREERLFFDMHGFRVMDIYVDIGDYVYEGDVIAALYWPDITTRLMNSNRRQEWLELYLSQLERRRQAGTITREHYLAQREQYTREMDILALELDYLTRQNQRRYLLSPMDGTVTHVAVFTEGMVSNTAVSFATIVDQSNSVFMVLPTIAEHLMTFGSYFTLYLDREPYRAVVIDPAEFGIQRDRGGEAYLIFADEAPVMPTRPLATVFVELEKAENVLYIPIQALHRASERVFVYVLTQSGVRVLRDVEVGLRGNVSYEIISGLDEGELVILD